MEKLVVATIKFRTHISSRGERGCSSAKEYEPAHAQLREEELIKLTMAVIVINDWNRLAIAFRPEAGKYQPCGKASSRSALYARRPSGGSRRQQGKFCFPAKVPSLKKWLIELESHLRDTGHSALKEDGDQIAVHINKFLDKQVKKMRVAQASGK